MVHYNLTVVVGWAVGHTCKCPCQGVQVNDDLCRGIYEIKVLLNKKVVKVGEGPAQKASWRGAVPVSHKMRQKRGMTTVSPPTKKL